MKQIENSHERKARSYLPAHAFLIKLWKSAFVESFQRQIGAFKLYHNSLRYIQQQNRNSMEGKKIEELKKIFVFLWFFQDFTVFTGLQIGSYNKKADSTTLQE